MEGVGLTTRRMRSSPPVEIPPRMPPQWLEEKSTPVVIERSGRKRSLLCEPYIPPQGEAITYLEAPHSIDRHHGIGQPCRELVVEGFAQPYGYAYGSAHHDTSYAVALVSGGADEGLHLLLRLGVGAPQRRMALSVYIAPAGGGVVAGGTADLSRVGDNLYAQPL